ncbi:hypothetical protein ACFL4A_05080, partial [bacterium]
KFASKSSDVWTTEILAGGRVPNGEEPIFVGLNADGSSWVVFVSGSEVHYRYKNISTGLWGGFCVGSIVQPHGYSKTNYTVVKDNHQIIHIIIANGYWVSIKNNIVIFNSVFYPFTSLILTDYSEICFNLNAVYSSNNDSIYFSNSRTSVQHLPGAFGQGIHYYGAISGIRNWEYKIDTNSLNSIKTLKYDSYDSGKIETYDIDDLDDLRILVATRYLDMHSKTETEMDVDMWGNIVLARFNYHTNTIECTYTTPALPAPSFYPIAGGREYKNLNVICSDTQYIVCQDATSNDLVKFKHETGGTWPGVWSGEVIDAPTSTGFYPSAVYNPHNKSIEIVYYDETNRNLKFATNNNSPLLSFTGEEGYTNSAAVFRTEMINGERVEWINFRIKYTDIDGDDEPVGSIKVYVYKAGVCLNPSLPVVMIKQSGDPINGKIFEGKYYAPDPEIPIESGTDYTYRIIAQDACGGEAELTGLGPVVNRSPNLAWEGVGAYIDDGIGEEEILADGTIVYRLVYQDPEGNAPSAGFPKVHIKKDDIPISGSPFTMSYVSGNHATGSIYEYSLQGFEAGNYTYFFDTYDETGNRVDTDISYEQVGENPGPTVYNEPTLSWSMNSGFTSDGHEYNPATDTLAFECKYQSVDNITPENLPSVEIKNELGAVIFDYPMTLILENEIEGMIFRYTTTFNSVENWSYKIHCKYKNTLPEISAPVYSLVVNKAPTLAWTSEYVDKGVNRLEGFTNSTYDFKVKYTDPEN